MRRRDLLKTVVLAPAIGLTAAVSADPSAPPPAEPMVPERPQTLTPDQWRTLASVQDHLLPSEPDNPRAPGAREVQATAYLDRALAVPGFPADTRAFILQGIGWLDDLAVERHQTPFRNLAAGPREDLLHAIAASPAGERWLSGLIGYTLEALLADPLYGGNPGGIGWTWLDHDPGRPRPTPETLFGRLGRP
jgi:gluconate 2-dehydrogenase gamma chain